MSTITARSTPTTTTTVYRSVSGAEAQDIKNTGRFNLAPGGMESKQFGFNLSETRQFGNKIYVDVEISLDKNLSFVKAHDISESIHHKLEKKMPEIKHCMVHANPSGK